jgi:hypothetical protein
MTTQTKRYIELSDILAFRCECKKCGVALTLPVAKDVGESILKCPRCGKAWTRFDDSTHEILVNEFAEKTQQLASALSFMGFNLTLEIRDEPEKARI